MKEDKILIGQIEDKMKQCESHYMTTRTGFLSLHERSIASGIVTLPGVQKLLIGGYDEAERVVCFFLPDYATKEDCLSQLGVIRVSKKPGGRQLTHRDYLGSLLSLGIDRSVIGDILVRDNGADIICLEEICDFILTHYFSAGSTELSVDSVNISQIDIPEVQFKEVTDTIASLRLDNVISSAFKVSRTKAVESINRGIVFVNNLEVNKADKKIVEGDKIVLRGKGKIILDQIQGKSRKDRTYVVYKVYI
ncbi:MAG: YlmH/Sll1252 family protein [Anaerovoracaceae bacterium]